MTHKQQLGITLLGTLMFAVGPLLAQEAADEGTTAEDEATEVATYDTAGDYVAVWSVIEAQWDASQQGNEDWVEHFLHEDFMGWSKTSPVPRDKASTRLWDEFGMKQSRGVEHELYPLSTVIHGNTAIAHYLYTNATENSDGKTELANGRYTDILVRVDGDWKLIGWHGGDDDQGD
jgi:ketosteroid isomerase-like protein